MNLLATPDHLVLFGHDPLVASAKLPRATTRVRRYLRGRTSAAGIFAADYTPTDELAEIVCAIAARMAATPDSVEKGARQEQAGAEQVTWGAEAYAGVSNLTQGEKDSLDELFPRRPFLIDPVRLRAGETE